MTSITEDRVNLVLAACGDSAGGSHRVIWELAARLAPSRFEVRVWLSAAPGLDEFARELERRGVLVERMPDVDSRWDWRGLVDLWFRLRRTRPTLLHIHHDGGCADRLAAVLLEAAGAPNLIVSEHVPIAPSASSGKPLGRRILARADFVAATCGAVAELLVSEHGVERDRVRIIPYGVDPPDEEYELAAARRVRQRLGTGSLRPLWVCPARLEPEKGHDVLLESLAELHGRGLAFAAALAGDGSLRRQLENRSQDLKLGPRVHFMGAVEDLGSLMCAADAVVFPSLWEAVPLALLEALARGRPVIASAVGGIPELIEDGVTGWLVPAGDSHALAAAIESLHHRPDLGLDLGANGARRVSEERSWARVVDAFEALYDEVMGLAGFTPDHGHGVHAWR